MTEPSHPSHIARTPWRSFWEKGGWWRAVLATIGYLLLFVVASVVIVKLGHSAIGDSTKNIATDAKAVTVALLLPEVAGALIATAFVASLAWFPKLLRRRPRQARWWMWIAPATMVVAAVVRLIGTKWSDYSGAAVVAILALGILVGYTEELLARGVNVRLLQRGGYGERTVMIASSALFALMHSVNAIGGAKPVEIVVTIAFAFFYGAAMYLTLLVTGSLVWAMVFHALTDPTTFLASGGVDGGTLGSGAAAQVGAWASLIYLVLFVVALFALPRSSQREVTS